MTLKDTYKGYTITYDGRRFTILLDDKEQTNRPKDMDACMAWVDKQLKEVFVRTKVIVDGSYRNTFNEAEATSIVEGKAWVSYSNSRRELVDVTSLRVLSKDNLGKIAKFKDLTAQAEALTKEARAIKGRLEVFDVNTMLVDK